MWLDITSMRPDEYLRQDAKYFTEIAVLKNAALKGIERSRDEKRANAELLTMPGG